MSKFCSDLECDFYGAFPDGSKFKTNLCPYCEAPLIGEHPNSVKEMNNETPLKESSSLYEWMFPSNNVVDVPNARPRSAPLNPINNVVVTFYTAILLTHYKSASSVISLRFRDSLPGDLSKDLNFKLSIVKNYQGDTYALLENSIDFPISILDLGGRKNTLIIPYNYLLDGQEERFYSDKGVACRTLLLNSYNFSLSNIITQYDMIISPANLPVDQQRDFKTLWKMTFHLYNPVTEILRDNKLVLPFSEIQSQVTNILYSLCYAYMICKTSKLFVLTKTTYIHLFDSEEEVNSFMRDLLLEWIDSIVDSDFPFLLKFCLSFLTVDKDMMLPCSSQIYFKLFKDINTDFILSTIKNESEQNMLLEYQQDILTSPQLLHRALQEVSSIDIENLITFLPLYHLVFNSEHSFSEAHDKHDFLNNSYWGLPPDIPFTNSTNIELTIILNTLIEYKHLGPILPHFVILLCLRHEIFPQLLEILEIPFLSISYHRWAWS